MKQLHRLAGIIIAGCSLTAASCASIEPEGGVVSLTQEAMAASAKLAEASEAPPKEGAQAESAVEAVAEWRGSSGETQEP